MIATSHQTFEMHAEPKHQGTYVTLVTIVLLVACLAGLGQLMLTNAQASVPTTFGQTSSI